MTFEQYLKENTSYVESYDIWLTDINIKDIIKHAENWHAYKLKEMRIKGANTTNSKYSKEERSEWAKKGGRPRKPVDNSNTTNK